MARRGAARPPRRRRGSQRSRRDPLGRGPDRRSAATSSRRSLKADPKFITAHLNRAELLVEDIGEYEQAVALCDELLAGKRELPRLDRGTEAEVYYLKAKAVFYLDDLEGALFLMRRAMKTAGEVPVYRAFDGQILFELGRFEEARRSLETAIALDPESGHALYHLGLVLERIGDEPRTPQRAFEAANALDPEQLSAAGSVDDEFFDGAVAEAIDNLPRSIREYVEDVPVLVEDYPSERADRTTRASRRRSSASTSARRAPRRGPTHSRST